MHGKSERVRKKKPQKRGGEQKTSPMRLVLEGKKRTQERGAVGVPDGPLRKDFEEIAKKGRTQNNPLTKSKQGMGEGRGGKGCGGICRRLVKRKNPRKGKKGGGEGVRHFCFSCGGKGERTKKCQPLQCRENIKRGKGTKGAPKTAYGDF